MITSRIQDRKLGSDILRMFWSPSVRKAGLHCCRVALVKFFLLQFRYHWFKGRVRVSQVDQTLDADIPFIPEKVDTYLDFVAFWLRATGFLLEHYGRKASADCAAFVKGMGELYEIAATVYFRNLSTTERPTLNGNRRFLLIRLLDPHLLCVPSLHILIVTQAYSHFRAIVQSRGDELFLADQILELRQGAIAIAEATMFVKQHSLNCVATALYAMTRLKPQLLPSSEVETFINSLFRTDDTIKPEQAAVLRKHILSLYQYLVQSGRSEADWRQPIFNYLKTCPEASSLRSTESSAAVNAAANKTSSLSIGAA